MQIDNAGGALEELRKNIDATQEVSGIRGVLSQYDTTPQPGLNSLCLSLQ